MLYKLHSQCPVPWTAVQERTISREFPTRPAAETAADYVSRTYYQFLWLPDSIMPLSQLTPALLLAPAQLKKGNSADLSAPKTTWSTQLNSLLRPLMQTPRSVSQKYRTRVAQLLLEEELEGEYTTEDDFMFLAMKYDKDDGAKEGETEAEAEERWRNGVLERMERREVMMQILVHLLLLTLPSPDVPAKKKRKPRLVSASPSPKKRERQDNDSQSVLSTEQLGEYLEILMDKLAMWQLVISLDDGTEEGRQRILARSASSSKGKGKEADERDWMQIFCEDLVEPLFKSTLPEQCELLRSKVFQSSPFSDDSDGLDLASPPASPKGKSRPLARTASRASLQPESQASVQRTTELSRARSLSVTLAEERVRERSRSLSIGPAKRVLAREVSMTTVFKGKAKAKPPTKAAVSQERARPTGARGTGGQRSSDRHGTTLVAATPVKPKLLREAQGKQQRDVLPMLLDNPEFFGGAVEGGDDDEEWTIRSAPDVLLLGDDGDHEAWLEATPTKKKRRS